MGIRGEFVMSAKLQPCEPLTYGKETFFHKRTCAYPVRSGKHILASRLRLCDPYDLACSWFPEEANASAHTLVAQAFQRTFAHNIR
jgi:hypothetical protein